MELGETVMEDQQQELIVHMEQEAVAEKVTKDEKTDLLQKANDYIALTFKYEFVTLYVDDEEAPLLSVLKTKNCDPFYVDQALLHANLSVNDRGDLEFALLAPNRELIGEPTKVTDINSELPILLQELADSELESCTGFRMIDPNLGTLFQRLRKADIDSTLIEKYAGSIVYRSRACTYAYDKSKNVEKMSVLFTQQCSNCQAYLTDLDAKYTGGQLLKKPLEEYNEPKEPIATSAADQETKRKRGRPKGSKNKNYLITIEEHPLTEEDDKSGIEKNKENEENDDPSERVLVDDPDFIYGTTDLPLEEEEEDEDFSEPAKSSVRLGFRKRITTKRQKALLETKRKRGRPPIKVGPIDCPDCGKAFDTAKDYRRHCQEHTNSFACTLGECVKRFKSQKDLDIHLRKHRGEKPYACTECDKAYAIRQDLRMHMRKHTGGRPYKCELCGKSFARSHQLAVHMPVHTGEKSHLCSECGSAFSSVSSLIDHRKRRHLEMRNHKCPSCPKAFFTRQELEAHNRTHTGDKPFQCPTCGKCFARPHHLKRHVAGVHNGEKSRLKSIVVHHKDDDLVTGNFQTADTVLFTTDDMGETVLIKEVDYLNSKQDGGGTTSDNDSVLVHSDSVVEIPGQEGGYVLVTTADDEQKLMPISQLSHLIATSSATMQQH